MSHQEIVALTNEDIKRLCDYECAVIGVKLMDPPIEPEKKVFTPTIEVFKVGDYYTEKEEVAQEIVAFFAKIREDLCKLEYNWKYGSDNQYIERNLTDYDYKIDMKKVKAFLPQEYNELKEEMMEYKTKMSSYEGLKKEFKDNEERREKETAWIHTKISAHKSLNYKVDTAKKEFNKYLNLAGGDQKIALNFFKKSLSEEESGPVAEYLISIFEELEDNECRDDQALMDRAIDRIQDY